MITVPKLVLLVLLGFAVWYAVRWLNRAPPKFVRHRQVRWPSFRPKPQAAIEDLVACRTCGAYVVAGARGCGKPGCPAPR
jgi:hypothetical protein